MCVTQDAFHRGAFHVLQPKNKGNRSGLDALLLAAAMPENSTGILADLGSGAGVAGLAALTLSPALQLLSIERNPEMLELAEQSLKLSENGNLHERVKIIEADVALSGCQRERAGLAADSVDHIIMNPPYNTKSNRPPLGVMRIEAFMMAEGGLDAWMRTAAAMLKPNGSFAIIYRTENLGQVIACAKGRFGKLEILPIHSRCCEPAKRIIVRGIRGSNAATTILPGFVVHDENGEFSKEANDIFDGKSSFQF